MSAKERTTQDRYDDPRFTPVGGDGRAVTESCLVEATTTDPPLRDAGSVLLYAVARRNGVVHTGPGIDGCHEGCRVLYVTADAERAIERVYKDVDAGSWDDVRAVISSPREATDETGPNATQLASVALPAHASQNTIRPGCKREYPADHDVCPWGCDDD
jgi:hypothetical protein